MLWENINLVSDIVPLVASPQPLSVSLLDDIGKKHGGLQANILLLILLNKSNRWLWRGILNHFWLIRSPLCSQVDES